MGMRQDTKRKVKVAAITSGVTLFVLTVLTGIVLLFLIIFAPATMANLTYRLGMYETSLHYLVKQYESTESVGDAYNVVNMSIKVKDTDKLIMYFEKMEAISGYKLFTDNINFENRNSTQTILERAAIMDINQYLKNRYVSALVERGTQESITKAINYSVKNFTNNGTNASYFTMVTFNNQGLYLFDSLFNSISNLQVLSALRSARTDLKQGETAVSVIQAVCLNFNHLINNFMQNYGVEEEGIDVPILALGLRLNTIAENIAAFNMVSPDHVIESTETVNGKLAQVNNVLKDMFNV